METIAAIIMIILFFVLLAFVFSTALLTPIIGKKNLFFVIFMGFIVGIIGGAFFISPIMDDIPNIAASYYQTTSKGVETLNIDVSTNIDINQFITDTKNIDGVKSVEVNGITIKTSKLSDQWKNILEKRIPMSNKGITSAKVLSDDSISIEIRDQSNPEETITKLKDWLMLVGGISVNYSLVHTTVKVETSKVYPVSNQLSKNAVITSVEGPTQDKLNNLKAMLPDKSNVVLLCGFIGILAGLAGLFIDTLLGIFGSFKEKVVKNK